VKILVAERQGSAIQQDGKQSLQVASFACLTGSNRDLFDDLGERPAASALTFQNLV